MPESATATCPDDGGLDVSVVLPVYNERGHLHDRDRPHPGAR